MQHRFSHWYWLLFSTALPGCAGYAPPGALIGMDRSAVITQMGPADRERPIDGSNRLEFPRGPYGKHTWFVYFDAAGRASRAEQVLTEQNFTRINAGMAQDEVLALLGRPGEVQLLGRSRGAVWSYRYENNDCRWFQIELSLERQVRSAGYGEPPECNKADRSGD
jgi:hypothetical protein